MADPITGSIIGDALLGGVLGNVVSSAIAPAPSAPASTAPTATRQTVMPTPDSQAVQQAQRRSITAQMARRGRASTILTGNQSASGETLGG